MFTVWIITYVIGMMSTFILLGQDSEVRTVKVPHLVVAILMWPVPTCFITYIFVREVMQLRRGS